eukprot:scaffold74080_cov35-Phaeocystis_antarctica.AAC.1
MDGRPQCCLMQVLARRVRGCNARHAGLERVPQVWVALDALRVLDGGCGIDGTEDDAGHKGEEEGERRLAIPVAAARLRVVLPEQQQLTHDHRARDSRGREGLGVAEQVERADHREHEDGEAADGDVERRDAGVISVHRAAPRAARVARQVEVARELEARELGDRGEGRVERAHGRGHHDQVHPREGRRAESTAEVRGLAALAGDDGGEVVGEVVLVLDVAVGDADGGEEHDEDDGEAAAHEEGHEHHARLGEEGAVRQHGVVEGVGAEALDERREQAVPA